MRLGGKREKSEGKMYIRRSLLRKRKGGREREEGRYEEK